MLVEGFAGGTFGVVAICSDGMTEPEIFCWKPVAVAAARYGVKPGARKSVWRGL